jgi:hypothetical protein
MPFLDCFGASRLAMTCLAHAERRALHESCGSSTMMAKMRIAGKGEQND